ncbi:hypothetical protein HYH02_012309 [Chlamydomonas schloesseri]|uniref:Sfi1 spindle body domain-containing protein n=1 Tax=Chlamydomonas schloesseri TaxID=2026947 RepID=A0A835TAH5_9CHLO|nr:hypothetical protein HYH02_012309 [Chlamydomonas schloesseri]|eukprot:KAG2434480.1 hypothetical protein HYH02_012309 [Chlamydomonas schloesseri]
MEPRSISPLFFGAKTPFPAQPGLFATTQQPRSVSPLAQQYAASLHYKLLAGLRPRPRPAPPAQQAPSWLPPGASLSKAAAAHRAHRASSAPYQRKSAQQPSSSVSPGRSVSPGTSSGHKPGGGPRSSSVSPPGGHLTTVQTPWGLYHSHVLATAAPTATPGLWNPAGSSALPASAMASKSAASAASRSAAGSTRQPFTLLTNTGALQTPAPQLAGVPHCSGTVGGGGAGDVLGAAGMMLTPPDSGLGSGSGSGRSLGPLEQLVRSALSLSASGYTEEEHRRHQQLQQGRQTRQEQPQWQQQEPGYGSLSAAAAPRTASSAAVGAGAGILWRQHQQDQQHRQTHQKQSQGQAQQPPRASSAPRLAPWLLTDSYDPLAPPPAAAAADGLVLTPPPPAPPPPPPHPLQQQGHQSYGGAAAKGAAAAGTPSPVGALLAALGRQVEAGLAAAAASPATSGAVTSSSSPGAAQLRPAHAQRPVAIPVTHLHQLQRHQRAAQPQASSHTASASQQPHASPPRAQQEQQPQQQTSPVQYSPRAAARTTGQAAGRSATVPWVAAGALEQQENRGTGAARALLYQQQQQPQHLAAAGSSPRARRGVAPPAPGEFGSPGSLASNDLHPMPPAQQRLLQALPPAALHAYQSYQQQQQPGLPLRPQQAWQPQPQEEALPRQPRPQEQVWGLQRPGQYDSSYVSAHSSAKGLRLQQQQQQQQQQQHFPEPHGLTSAALAPAAGPQGQEAIVRQSVLPPTTAPAPPIPPEWIDGLSDSSSASGGQQPTQPQPAFSYSHVWRAWQEEDHHQSAPQRLSAGPQPLQPAATGTAPAIRSPRPTVSPGHSPRPELEELDARVRYTAFDADASAIAARLLDDAQQVARWPDRARMALAHLTSPQPPSSGATSAGTSAGAVGLATAAGEPGRWSAGLTGDPATSMGVGSRGGQAALHVPGDSDALLGAFSPRRSAGGHGGGVEVGATGRGLRPAEVMAGAPAPSPATEAVSAFLGRLHAESPSPLPVPAAAGRRGEWGAQQQPTALAPPRHQPSRLSAAPRLFQLAAKAFEGWKHQVALRRLFRYLASGRETRIMVQVFGAWHDIALAQQTRRVAAAASFSRQRRVRLVAAAFAGWRAGAAAAARVRHAAEHRARSLRARTLLLRALRGWKPQQQQQQQQQHRQPPLSPMPSAEARVQEAWEENYGRDVHRLLRMRHCFRLWLALADRGMQVMQAQAALQQEVLGELVEEAALREAADLLSRHRYLAPVLHAWRALAAASATTRANGVDRGEMPAGSGAYSPAASGDPPRRSPAEAPAVLLPGVAVSAGAIAGDVSAGRDMRPQQLGLPPLPPPAASQGRRGLQSPVAEPGAAQSEAVASASGGSTTPLSAPAAAYAAAAVRASSGGSGAASAPPSAGPMAGAGGATSSGRVSASSTPPSMQRPQLHGLPVSELCQVLESDLEWLTERFLTPTGSRSSGRPWDDAGGGGGSSGSSSLDRRFRSASLGGGGATPPPSRPVAALRSGAQSEGGGGPAAGAGAGGGMPAAGGAFELTGWGRGADAGIGSVGGVALEVVREGSDEEAEAEMSEAAAVDSLGGGLGVQAAPRGREAEPRALGSLWAGADDGRGPIEVTFGDSSAGGSAVSSRRPSVSGTEVSLADAATLDAAAGSGRGTQEGSIRGPVALWPQADHQYGAAEGFRVSGGSSAASWAPGEPRVPKAPGGFGAGSGNGLAQRAAAAVDKYLLQQQQQAQQRGMAGDGDQQCFGHGQDQLCSLHCYEGQDQVGGPSQQHDAHDHHHPQQQQQQQPVGMEPLELHKHSFAGPEHVMEGEEEFDPEHGEFDPEHGEYDPEHGEFDPEHGEVEPLVPADEAEAEVEAEAGEPPAVYDEESWPPMGRWQASPMRPGQDATPYKRYVALPGPAGVLRLRSES